MYPSHLIGKILQQLLLSNNFLYWQLLSSITFSRPVTPFSMYLRDFSCVCTIYILMYTYFSPKNVGIIAYLVHFWLKLYCIMYLVLLVPTYMTIYHDVDENTQFFCHQYHPNPTNTPCLTLENMYTVSELYNNSGGM